MKVKSNAVRTPPPNRTGAETERLQYNLRESSKLFGVPTSTLRKLCHKGILNPITGFGRKWYIAAADLRALMGRRLRN